MMDGLLISELLNLDETIAADFFRGVNYAWELIPKIRRYIIELGESLTEGEYDKIGEDVWISKSAKVADTASIIGPAIIGHNVEIRHCAYIRGSVIVGDASVIGNSTELKNAILFNEVQVPHFNYVGDSILGHRSHIGAGGITSNVKSDKSMVKIRYNDEVIATNLKKFGAVLGDYVEVGSNSVLNPGTIIGRSSNIYPLSMVRGYVPPNCIYKKLGEIINKKYT